MCESVIDGPYTVEVGELGWLIDGDHYVHQDDSSYPAVDLSPPRARSERALTWEAWLERGERMRVQLHTGEHVARPERQVTWNATRGASINSVVIDEIHALEDPEPRDGSAFPVVTGEVPEPSNERYIATSFWDASEGGNMVEPPVYSDDDWAELGHMPEDGITYREPVDDHDRLYILDRASADEQAQRIRDHIQAAAIPPITWTFHDAMPEEGLPSDPAPIGSSAITWSWNGT